MKKVRLFAVAAAMGMFASTVTAAETTTGYVATWGEVGEIIKVDVGDKVVAPTSTIKVVKETRTTDAEEALKSDELGFSLEDIPCYVGNTDEVGKDKKDLGWTDDQVYYIPDATSKYKGKSTWAEIGFYNSKEEAVEVLLNRGVYLEPGAEEVKDPSYYTLYDGKKFADWEEVYAYALEEGFVEEVYDEDGELTDILLNKTEITDEDDNLKYVAAIKLHLGESKYSEEETKKAVVDSLDRGYNEAFGTVSTYWTATPVIKKNYTQKKENNVLNYYFDSLDTLTTTDDANGLQDVAVGKVLIVEEDRYGDLLPVGLMTDTIVDPYGKTVEAAAGKIKVVVKEEADKEFKAAHQGVTHYYNTLVTVTPATAAKWSAESRMVWDIEAGAFVKEEIGYDNFTNVKGYWWAEPVKLHENVDEQENDFEESDIKYGANVLGVEKLDPTPENDSDKYVITMGGYDVTGLNTKTNKMTIAVGDTELTLDAVKLSTGWKPAVSSKADLVRVVAKLAGVGEFAGEALHGLDDANITNVKNGDPVVQNDWGYVNWYLATEAANENPWSGFSFEGSLPVTELRGAESKQCTYKVADGEEVEATVSSNADSVDTSVAGVKTLTLTAKVGEEVVSTKEVKVVVAPKYERTYVNGKVSVLKAFHLNGNLYAEYHYDWAAKTYSATFYQQDGVTVGSTANGTL